MYGFDELYTDILSTNHAAPRMPSVSIVRQEFLDKILRHDDVFGPLPLNIASLYEEFLEEKSTLASPATPRSFHSMFMCILVFFIFSRHVRLESTS